MGLSYMYQKFWGSYCILSSGSVNGGRLGLDLKNWNGGVVTGNDFASFA